MTCPRKDPLRVLTKEEQDVLKQIARARSEPASHVARAKSLLAVADGKTYGEAAQAAGRRSDDAVSHLVARFNQEGLLALEPRHGVDRRLSTGSLNRNGSWPKRDARQTGNKMGPRVGRWQRCSALCNEPPMGYPKSVSIRFG